MNELQNNTDFKFIIGINLTDYCFLFLMRIFLLIHQNQCKYFSIYESSPLWVVSLMSTKSISLIPGKIPVFQCSSRHTYLLRSYIGNNCLIVSKNILHSSYLYQQYALLNDVKVILLYFVRNLQLSIIPQELKMT